MEGSSCFQLERFLGWRGICIEPHADFFATLTKHRPGSAHENVCLAAEDGLVEYVPAGEGESPYCSGVRDVLLNLKKSGRTVAEQASAVRMPALSLASILRKHNAPAVIDYGAFDIEGSEWEALRLFPFDEFRFLAISCEVSGNNKAPFRDLLAKNGYVEATNPLNHDCPWEFYWLHESITSR